MFRPWKEAMLTLTGQPDMNTDALREYFLPLENFLKKENRKNNVQVRIHKSIFWGKKIMPKILKKGLNSTQLYSALLRPVAIDSPVYSK